MSRIHRAAATAAALLAALTAVAPAALADVPPVHGTPVIRITPVTAADPVPAPGAAPAVPRTGAVPYGATSLMLTVGARSRAATAPRSVTLACDPAGGRHPNAREACDELTAADGGFDRLRAATRGMCPMIYAPVTATATGTWQGRPVVWSQEFANGCVLARSTGAVFQF